MSARTEHPRSGVALLAGRAAAGDARARCLLFDYFAPVGAPVLLRLDDGSLVRRKVRHRATVLPCGEPVVWLEGVVGAYALDRARITADTVRFSISINGGG